MLNLSRIILDKHYIEKDKTLYEKIIKYSTKYYLEDIVKELSYYNETIISEYQRICHCRKIQDNIFMNLIDNDLYVKKDDIIIKMELRREFRNFIGYDACYNITLYVKVKLKLKYGITITYSANNGYVDIS